MWDAECSPSIYSVVVVVVIKVQKGSCNYKIKKGVDDDDDAPFGCYRNWNLMRGVSFSWVGGWAAQREGERVLSGACAKWGEGG